MIEVGIVEPAQSGYLLYFFNHSREVYLWNENEHLTIYIRMFEINCNENYFLFE